MVISLLIGIIALTRRPRSGMKNSFSFVCFLFFISNLFVTLEDGYGIIVFNSYREFFSYLQYITILFFVFYFPNHFRNMPGINQLIWFVLGGILSSGIYEFCIIGQDKIRSIIVFFTLYSIAGFIIYLKTWKYFSNIKSFMRSSILMYALVLLFFILQLLWMEESVNTFQPLQYWNLLFLLIFLSFLAHFTFRSNYVSIPLSTLFERTEKVLHLIEPANKKGSAILKSKLIEYYEGSRLKDFVEEFHFHLLVDETLDNAIEHGGKRSYDDITIYVFESKKFTDIYVIDRGKGFNPKKIPNPLSQDRKMVPSGRGIHILKGLFKVRWNFLGNEVCVRIPSPLQKSKEKK
ncbi:MAG: ATP-binding protein [Leptospira sp.]|nr:ATP-binding protein [Leptospira sp.]